MLRWRLVGREMNHVVCKWDLRYVSNKFELTSLTLLHTSKIVTEAYQVKRISFTHPQNGFACFSMGTARDIFAFTSFLLVSGTLLEDFPAFRLVLNWQQGLLSIWDAASDFNSENTSFSSPEPTILLACGRNRELWEQPFQACAIDEDWVKPDGQNSVISFVIS